MAYDPSTVAGKVRLLIADTDDSNQIFSDAEISAFLAVNNDSLARSAAMALRAIASSKSRLAQVIKSLDVNVDLSKMAAELRATAQSLEDSDDEGTFAIIQMAPDRYGVAEKIDKDIQREGI